MMKTTSSVVVLLLFSFSVTCWFSSVPFAQLTPETVLATSTAGDVLFADVAPDWPLLGSDSEKLRLVRNALKERIYAQAAEQEKIHQGPEIEKQLEEARLAALLETLFLREKGELKPTEQQLRAHYENNRSLYFFDEHVYFRHVAVDIEKPTLEASRLQAKAEALEALSQLKQGVDFAQVVERFSDDRLYGARRIGPVPLQEAPEPWRREIARLKPGQRSELIELPGRFEIVELLEHVPAGYLPFEQARAAIEERVTRELQRQAKTDFVSRLVQSIPVVIEHADIANPQTKGSKVVVRSKFFKMDKEQYERWFSQQPRMTQRLLGDPLKREIVVRQELLLAPYVKSLAQEQKIERDAVFQKLFQQERRAVLSRHFEEYLFTQNPSSLQVTPEDVQQYYSEHLEEFLMPPRAMIRDIIVQAEVEPDMTGEARALAFRYAEQQAQDIIAQLKAGKITFAMAALRHRSTMEPGGFFEVRKGDQDRVFDEAVFQLKPGEITSTPIRTEEGYCIVELRQIYPEVQLPIEQVRDRIIRKLNREKSDNLKSRLENLYFEKAKARIFEDRILQVSSR